MMSKFERREIDKLYMYKKESQTKLCDIYLILLFNNSKKKILTMATVYMTGICLHVNTFWAVKLHLITIGKIMHENGKLTMTFSFWWYLNVQGILFTSYTM